MTTFLIPKHAVVKRINRALRRQFPLYDNGRTLAGRHLRRARSAQIRRAYGEYFVFDRLRNGPVETYVNVGDLARALGVLRTTEQADA